MNENLEGRNLSGSKESELQMNGGNLVRGEERLKRRKSKEGERRKAKEKTVKEGRKIEGNLDRRGLGIS